MADMLLEELKKGGYQIKDSYNYMKNIVPCIIEYFDSITLKYLHEKTDI